MSAPSALLLYAIAGDRHLRSQSPRLPLDPSLTFAISLPDLETL